MGTLSLKKRQTNYMFNMGDDALGGAFLYSPRTPIKWKPPPKPPKPPIREAGLGLLWPLVRPLIKPIIEKLIVPAAKTTFRGVVGGAARIPYVKKLVPAKAREVPLLEVAKAVPTVAGGGVLAMEVYDLTKRGVGIGQSVAETMFGTDLEGVGPSPKAVVDPSRGWPGYYEEPPRGVDWPGVASSVAKEAFNFLEDRIGKSLNKHIPAGGDKMGHPSAGTALQRRGPTAMGMMPDSNAIVRTWHANGIPFWRTMDGWIYVQRLDGTVKRYRPYKSVVLGKRPSSKMVNRAINKLKQENKIYRKLNALFAPKRRG